MWWFKYEPEQAAENRTYRITYVKIYEAEATLLHSPATRQSMKRVSPLPPIITCASLLSLFFPFFCDHVLRSFHGQPWPWVHVSLIRDLRALFPFITPAHSLHSHFIPAKSIRKTSSCQGICSVPTTIFFTSLF